MISCSDSTDKLHCSSTVCGMDAQLSVHMHPLVNIETLWASKALIFYLFLIFFTAVILIYSFNMQI